MRTKKKEKVIDRQEKRIEKTKCRCCKTVTNKPRRPIFLQILARGSKVLFVFFYIALNIDLPFSLRPRRDSGAAVSRETSSSSLERGLDSQRDAENGELGCRGQQRRPILGDLTFEKVKQPLAKRALAHAGGGQGGWRRALVVERRSKLTASETEELERTRVGRRRREEESETVPAEDTGSNTHKNTCVRAHTWCLEIA